ncbi:MAG TPA: carotenoid oxygenase family protein [Gemmatales bacterium]|nr:carotenoid oxygenase family protein [Gemmatales bacterium]
MSLDRRHFLHGSLATLAGLHPGIQSWGQLIDNEPPGHEFLKGNYAPIHEEVTLDSLKVIGSIPKELDGMYVRNGPNPLIIPKGAYHWFEGDAMLHGVSLHEGKASYRNRFIQTEGYLKEKAAGKKLYASLMEMPDMKEIMKGKNPFKNAASTALVWHAKKFLALYEGGKPYSVKLPSLDTEGEYDFNKKLQANFTAHPKVDPVTREMLGFAYAPQPVALFYQIARDGTWKSTVPIKLDKAVMMHDFAVTPQYAIFYELPETFELTRTFTGKPPWYFNEKLPSRFGVVARQPDAQGKHVVKWFESKPCFIFHTLNAYEEGGNVVVQACRYHKFPGTIDGDSKSEKQHAVLYRWSFNMKTGQVSEGPMDDAPTEFPRINDALALRSTKFGYCGTGEGDFFSTMLKYELATGKKQAHPYGPGRFGGEGVFVARPGSKDEDDGWLLNYVYDKAENKSELVIVATQDFTGKPVARVLLPVRVPYGFHGAWVGREEFA